MDIRGNTRTRVCAVVLTIGMLMGLVSHAQAGSNYITVKLPMGISVDVPQNWQVQSQNSRTTLDSSVEGMLDLSDIQPLDSNLVFAANLYNDDRKTIALMNVRVYPELLIESDVAAKASEKEIRELDKEFQAMFEKALPQTGIRIVKHIPMKKVDQNGRIALESGYIRSSPHFPGTFTAKMIRIWTESGSATLTVSFRNKQSFLLKPIIQRIKSSFTMK